MAVMITGLGGLRNIERMIRQEMKKELAYGLPVTPAYVLRRDGHTDVYQMINRKIVKTRTTGHVTFGLIIEDWDLPCIVAP